MELMLDSADLGELKRGLADWPVSGVTTNPTILRRAGESDVWAQLQKIRALAGDLCSLHVQVVADDTAAMLEEAALIREKLGEETFIKVPVSAAGLPAIKALAAEGVNVTATAIYTPLQGMLAVMAGARYAAVYFSRIARQGGDPERVVRELVTFIDSNRFDCRLLAASFHAPEEVARAYAAGAHSATVAPAVLRAGLGAPEIAKAVADFAADFAALRGAAGDLRSL